MSAPGTEDLTAFMHTMIPITAAMGVEVLEASRTTVATRLPLAPNANHLGTSYAGSLFTAAELLGGLLASTGLALEGAVPVVRSVTVDFRRPATGDVVARASLEDAEIERILATTREHGKADFELVAEITDAEGTVVATTRGAYQLRRLS